MFNPRKKTLICGDFNLNPSENELSKKLVATGFHQIVSEATHVKGGILDHVYSKPFQQVTKLFIHPLYFSDHDAICVTLKYDETNVVRNDRTKRKLSNEKQTEEPKSKKKKRK